MLVQGDVVDAVFNLPSIAVVLSLDTSGFIPALGGSRFVNASDRVGTCVLGGNDLLATISQHLIILDNACPTAFPVSTVGHFARPFAWHSGIGLSKTVFEKQKKNLDLITSNAAVGDASTDIST